MKRIYIILVALLALVPIGLYLTDAPAWGEWDNSYYQKTLGFIPKSIENATSTALFSDYSIKGLGDVPSYYISALIGIILIFAFFYLLKKFIKNG